LREDFAAYVGGNPHIHFSAGYAMAKPGTPVRQLVAEAEEALELAKQRTIAPLGLTRNGLVKNAIALHGAVLGWEDWPAVDELAGKLDELVGRDALSGQFLYELLGLARMAADQSRPENARWRARLHYQCRRFSERIGGAPGRIELRANSLIHALGEVGIGRNPEALLIALHEHIYSLRD
jgi:CRISPR-associated protein Csm1